MRRPLRCAPLYVTAALSLLASCSTGPKPFTTPTTGAGPVPLAQVRPGVYRIPEGNADAVLALAQRPEVRVLVLGTIDPERVSDAHMTAIRDWVQQGGVLWVEGRAVESGALKLVLPVKVDTFTFRKTTTGSRAGELVVRGATPQMMIHDSPLTAGVSQLYLYPRYRFDGTPDAQPLVELTDESGNHGTVLADVRLGRGLVVLDGTARENRALFGRIEGFDANHPNAIEQNGNWNSYDWNTLVANAQSFTSRGDETGTGGTAPPDNP